MVEPLVIDFVVLEDLENFVVQVREEYGDVVLKLGRRSDFVESHIHYLEVAPAIKKEMDLQKMDNKWHRMKH